MTPQHVLPLDHLHYKTKKFRLCNFANKYFKLFYAIFIRCYITMIQAPKHGYRAVKFGLLSMGEDKYSSPLKR
jgi:hypothetical protein